MMLDKSDPRKRDEGEFVVWLDDITDTDSSSVGHKSVNLARVRRMAHTPISISSTDDPDDGSVIPVPDGFVVTTHATQRLLRESGVATRLRQMQTSHLSRETTVREYSEAAQALLHQVTIPDWFSSAVSAAHDRLRLRAPDADTRLAVRSSAVLEDLAGSSFAGQFDSILGISTLDDLLDACLSILASSFNVRALAYQESLPTRSAGEADAPTATNAMSVLVQRMVRSDVGSAGVLISSTVNPTVPDSPELVCVIESSWGTGEGIVGGSVDPVVHVVRLSDRSVTRASGPKPNPVAAGPTLDDTAALLLGRWARLLESEYGHPVEVEWARDGLSGELAVVQVRPHPTVEPCPDPSRVPDLTHMTKLCEGLAIGTGQVTGEALVVEDPLVILESEDLEELPEGFILVVPTTSPEWVPLMRLASALVTDHGGRGSHAAIVCRELGIPAVLGCGNATQALLPEPDDVGTPGGRRVVIRCNDGDRGVVYG